MNRLNIIATAGYLSADSVDYACSQWKMSNEETNAINILVKHRDACKWDPLNLAYTFDDMVAAFFEGKYTKDEVSLLLQFDRRFQEMEKWDKYEFPVFPVTGKDLIALGYKPGPEFGEWLAAYKSLWVRSGYTATKEDLLEGLTESSKKNGLA